AGWFQNVAGLGLAAFGALQPQFLQAIAVRRAWRDNDGIAVRHLNCRRARITIRNGELVLQISLGILHLDTHGNFGSAPTQKSRSRRECGYLAETRRALNR